MNRHLADVSMAVTPGRHGVVVLDGAGWHRATDLAIPDNLTLLRLPPTSPKLNPIENLFGFLKSNVLANRVLATVDDVRAAISDAWKARRQDAGRISSITTRTWARNVAPTPHAIASFYRKRLIGIGMSTAMARIADCMQHDRINRSYHRFSQKPVGKWKPPKPSSTPA